MPICSVCGADHDVYRFNVHKYSFFDTNENDTITSHIATGNPVEAHLVSSHWHTDTLCLECAKHVWGVKQDSSESYPEGYSYEPYPAKFYYCIGCKAYHIFPNAFAWSEPNSLPDLYSGRFITVYTSGRGNRTCNLPPYTTASFVPYCNHVVACSNSYHNGSLAEALGKDIDVCSFCGRYVISDWVRTDFSGASFLCYDCIDTSTVCDGCGDRIHLYDVFVDNSTDETLCESCYDSRSHGSDDEYDEDDEDCEEYIKNYNYKPSPIFYSDEDNDSKFHKDSMSTKQPYFGVELEVDQTSSRRARIEPTDMAKKLMEEIEEFNDRFYIKYDGSLNNGLEIVSHPHTYSQHFNTSYWRQIFTKCIANGFTSHDASTCGLHFHINRDSLGNTREERSDTAFRMVLLTEVMWNDFVKFSRRTGFHYCSKHNVWEKKDSFDKFKDKARSNLSRYNAMNISNPNTVEFRLCRGTLNFTTFMASLQFTYMIRLVALTLNNVAISNSTFSLFIETANRLGFREFLSYCKSRGFTHSILDSIDSDSTTPTEAS